MDGSSIHQQHEENKTECKRGAGSDAVVVSFSPGREKKPQTEEYTTKESDSMIKIAYKFGMSISQLQRLNGFSGDSHLYPGTKLNVIKYIPQQEDDDDSSPDQRPARTSSGSGGGKGVSSIFKEWQNFSAQEYTLSSLMNASRRRLSSVVQEDPKKNNQNDQYINEEEIVNKDFVTELFDQFSNYSKAFEYKAPKQREDLKEFLTMFDAVNMLPTISKARKINPMEFIPLHKDRPGFITEAFFCTKLGQVKGTLDANIDGIFFNPDLTQENEFFENLEDYKGILGYQDIGDMFILKLVNEAAIQVENDYIRDSYMFDYFIQFDLTSVNGLALKRETPTDSKISIANIFIRFTHRDNDNIILTNANQLLIVEEVHKLLEEVKEKAVQLVPEEICGTCLPYYDSIIDQSQRGRLGEVPMSPTIVDMVKNQQLKRIVNDKKEDKEQQLINFCPNKDAKSELLNDYQISNLVELLPPIVRPYDWELVYSMNRDGVSMGTFFENIKKHEPTIMIVQDNSRGVFGGYCTAAWKKAQLFYGSGENFLFSFLKDNKPKVFRWTGENEQFMFADENQIALGGGSDGRFGLSLSDDFIKGTSARCSTFDNDILSTKGDFTCIGIEVWALI